MKCYITPRFLSVMTFLVTIEVGERNFFLIYEIIIFRIVKIWLKRSNFDSIFLIASLKSRYSIAFIYLLCQSVQKKKKKKKRQSYQKKAMSTMHVKAYK